MHGSFVLLGPVWKGAAAAAAAAKTTRRTVPCCCCCCCRRSCLFALVVVATSVLVDCREGKQKDSVSLACLVARVSRAESFARWGSRIAPPVCC
jgi:hypothetical protein